MSRERFHIPHQLRLLRLRSNTADPAPELDGLACDFALEGPEDELAWVRGVEDVEAGPVCAV